MTCPPPPIRDSKPSRRSSDLLSVQPATASRASTNATVLGFIGRNPFRNTATQPTRLVRGRFGGGSDPARRRCRHADPRRRSLGGWPHPVNRERGRESQEEGCELRNRTR